MHPHHPSIHAPPPRVSRSTTPSAASSPSVRRGLYAYVGHRVVELLTEQQLVDHARSVLPQLHSVAARPHFHGPHWTTLRKKHGVDLFEFDPSSAASTSRSSLCTPPVAASSHASTAASSTSSLPHGFQSAFKLPNPGIDMAYAAVAQCELEGSVHDVVDALFNDDAVEFEGSMNALWNHKLKRGDLLLSRNVRARSSTFADDHYDESARDRSHLAIKTATIGAGLHLHRKLMGAEKLCYTSLTHVSPSTNEAFHVIKTLPPDVHDQIACGKTHVALRDPSIDHIAVGYHLIGTDSVLGGARTRLVVCAYASAVPSVMTPSSRASQCHWHPRMDVPGLAGVTDDVGSDVRRIVLMLAKAARAFPQLVRQRRFGHQKFVYFPTERQSSRALEPSCVVCLRRFGLFRKDHYCQLCGHLVCRLCSKKHKVEPLAGKVRENRICFPCIARVDSGTFHDEQLWRSLDRAVVVDGDVISPMGFQPILEDGSDDDRSPAVPVRPRDSTDLKACEVDTDQDAGLDRSFGSAGSGSTAPSSARRDIQVAYDLFSPHPERRASALEALSRVVLDARLSIETSHHDRHLSSVDFSVHDTPKSKPRPKSERMQRFAVCYPRANPTTAPSYGITKTPLLESVDQEHRESYKRVLRTSAPLAALDTAAFDSICEAVVQRLGFAVVMLVVQRHYGTPQVVGLHQSLAVRAPVPRHVEFPNHLVRDGQPLVVIEPTRDLRFHAFRWLHDARIRFFAEFPLTHVTTTGHDAIVAASLCALDTNARDPHLSKHALQTVKTLCAVASDLVSSIGS